MKSEYDNQAEKFLSDNGLKFRATLSDSKAAGWEPSGHHYRVTISRKAGPGRHRAFNVYDNGRKIDTVFYSASDKIAADEVKRSLVNHDGYNPNIVVRLDSNQGNRLTFDFWGSLADMEAGKTEIDAYSVLACISGDVHSPDTFQDFCSEYGYEADSIKALQTFRRSDRFAKRLRAFFTDKEIEQLNEIQ